MKYRTRKVQVKGLHNSAKISFNFFSFFLIIRVTARLRSDEGVYKKTEQKMLAVIDPFKTEVNCHFNS